MSVKNEILETQKKTFLLSHLNECPEIEDDQEIPQSHTADQSTAS